MSNLSFQECLDCTFSWFGGLASFPLLPSAQNDDEEEDEEVPENMRETAKEREERKSDYDVARQDVVKAKDRKIPQRFIVFLFLPLGMFYKSRSNEFRLCFRVCWR